MGADEVVISLCGGCQGVTTRKTTLEDQRSASQPPGAMCKCPLIPDHFRKSSFPPHMLSHRRTASMTIRAKCIDGCLRVLLLAALPLSWFSVDMQQVPHEGV